MKRSRAVITLAALTLGLAVLLAACGGTPSRRKADPPHGTPAARSKSASPSSAPESNGPLVPDDLKVPPTAAAGSPVRWPGRVVGADTSWPQCRKGLGIPQKRTLGMPPPTAAARFVVVGLTNGPSFTPNPCLAQQVAWARALHLPTSAYAVVSWPDAKTVKRFGGSGPFGASRTGKLSNAGYQAALYDVRIMRTVGLPSPGVWVDVETVTHFDWQGTPTQNAAVVRGAVRGFQDAGLKVGLYSTQGYWRDLVGGVRLGLPEWRAAGGNPMAEALHRCSASWTFQGGEALIGQWVEDRRDRDVTCPGKAAEAAGWFHRF